MGKILNFTKSTTIANPTKEKWEAIFQLALANGVNITDQITKDFNTTYSHIGWDNNDKHITAYCAPQNSISFEDFAVAIINARAYLKMQLTPSYEAIVESEGIKVGCQTITYEKFDELTTLVNQFKQQR